MWPATNVSRALLLIWVLYWIVPSFQTLIRVWPFATEVVGGVSFFARSFACRTGGGGVRPAARRRGGRFPPSPSAAAAAPPRRPTPPRRPPLGRARSAPAPRRRRPGTGPRP